MNANDTALNIINGNIAAAKQALADHGVTDTYVLDVLSALAVNGDEQFLDDGLLKEFRRLRRILAN